MHDSGVPSSSSEYDSRDLHTSSLSSIHHVHHLQICLPVALQSTTQTKARQRLLQRWLLSRTLSAPQTGKQRTPTSQTYWEAFHSFLRARTGGRRWPESRRSARKVGPNPHALVFLIVPPPRKKQFADRFVRLFLAHTHLLACSHSPPHRRKIGASVHYLIPPPHK